MARVGAELLEAIRFAARGLAIVDELRSAASGGRWVGMLSWAQILRASA
jgi:hypothetical protein